MGIIGYGRIGQATGRIAQALGMKVLACDPRPIRELESETMRYVDLEELLAQSDVIVLPLCPDGGNQGDNQQGDHWENEGWGAAG